MTAFRINSPARVLILAILILGVIPLAATAELIPPNDPLLSVGQHHHINPATYTAHNARLAKPPLRRRLGVVSVIGVMFASISLLTFKLASRRRPIGQESQSTWRVEAPPFEINAQEKQPHLRNAG